MLCKELPGCTADSNFAFLELSAILSPQIFLIGCRTSRYRGLATPTPPPRGNGLREQQAGTTAAELTSPRG